MQQRKFSVTLWMILLAILVTACSEITTPQSTLSSGNRSGRTSPYTPVATTPRPQTVVQRVSAQNTPAIQTPEQTIINIWWPNDLYPEGDSDAARLLENQLELFQLTYSSYDIDFRRKRTSGLGGIISTLRTAAPVAPGALPDLTLMRRADMITAAREGLIVPVGAWMPADLAGGNLFPGVRALGEYNGELYGVPYTLDFQHAIYRPAVFETPPLTFEDVLAAEMPYVFPANTSPVSWTVLLQYFGAGGQLVDANGNATLNADALQAVLTYYANGLERDIFDPLLLDYQGTSDYWNSFVTAETNIASINSHSYLTLRESVQNIGLVPIPSLSGVPLTMLDGWMWVVTTHNPDHQQRALAFLSWMMRVSQHGAFTEALGAVPSQTRALRLWNDQVYADFAQSLISTAVVFPEERRNNTAAAALQEAVSAVLRGTSPEVATGEALARLNQ